MLVARLMQSRPFLFFFVALFAGIFVSLIYSNALALVPGHVPAGFDQLSERQKALLSEEQDLSKWLLGLASGALAAAIGIRLSDKPSEDSPVMMIAYAALIVSLFGAFLSHETRLSILRIGPLDYVYSPLFLLATRVQFWSFLAGISALGWSLFRPRPKALSVIVLFLVVHQVKAQTNTTLDLSTCSSRWYADRFNGANADVSVVTEFLSALERKNKLARGAGATRFTQCADVDRVLDQVRMYSVSQEHHPDTSGAMTAYLRDLQPEVSGPNLTMGEAVSRFLSTLNPLGVPFGVLAVRFPDKVTPAAQKSYRIYVDGLFVGYVNWIGRVTAQPHRVRVLSSSGYTPVFEDLQYTVAEGESKIITVEVTP